MDVKDIQNNQDLVMALEAIARAIRSPFEDQQYTDYTPTITGFSGTPTINHARYKKIGKTCHVLIDIIGTSNSGAFSFTVPFAAKRQIDVLVRCLDNGGISVSPSLLEITQGSSTAQLYNNSTGAAFTASGSKRIYAGSFVYEIE